MRKLCSSVTDIRHGQNFTLVEPVNLYGCTFGDNVFVGPFVEIQSDVVIGNNVRVQSHSFICQYVSVGDDCFIGHSVVFINDLFTESGPARGRKELYKTTSLGRNVSLGSNSTILPVRICDNVVIGAGSVVVKDITESGIYAGNPARKIK